MEITATLLNPCDRLASHEIRFVMRFTEGGNIMHLHVKRAACIARNNRLFHKLLRSCNLGGLVSFQSEAHCMSPMSRL